MRHRAATLAARAAAGLSQLRGGGGTALPGVVGLKFDPRLVGKLSSRLGGTIVVTGTNGKTTTSRFIGALLEETGHPYVHNQSGSNLLRGLAATLATARTLTKQHWGLFEVDEATMPAACQELRPDLVVVTNLFRDQLDRYGELKRTAELIAAGLAVMPKRSHVILNADDPLVASLGRGLAARVSYFGIADTRAGHRELPHAADSVSDPATGKLLEYDRVFVGHLGHYRSPGRNANRLRRPRPDVAATAIRLSGIAGSSFRLGKTAFSLGIPGLYNIYNALAAVAAGRGLRLPDDQIASAIGGTAAAFGRTELITIGRKKVFIGLIKNPTGTNEVIETLALASSQRHVLVAINDSFADGTDISWLWDADFEKLVPLTRRFTVSGRRGDEMTLRLKYAGVDPQRVKRVGNLGDALNRALSAVPNGGTLYVLPTYTAMLELRRILTKQGHLKHYLS